MLVVKLIVALSIDKNAEIKNAQFLESLQIEEPETNSDHQPNVNHCSTVN